MSPAKATVEAFVTATDVLVVRPNAPGEASWRFSMQREAKEGAEVTLTIEKSLSTLGAQVIALPPEAMLMLPTIVQGLQRQVDEARGKLLAAEVL